MGITIFVFVAVLILVLVAVLIFIFVAVLIFIFVAVLVFCIGIQSKKNLITNKIIIDDSIGDRKDWGKAYISTAKWTAGRCRINAIP